MKRLLALFFLINFFIACNSDRVPDGIIERDQMVNVLMDIHLADGYSSVNYGDPNRQKIGVLYSAIYKKYGTDSVKVRKSLNYYTQHPDVLQSMYEQINSRLQVLEKESRLYQEQQSRRNDQRMRDSLWMRNSLNHNSINKGFKLDSVRVFPFYVPFYTGRISKKADSLKTKEQDQAINKNSLKPLKK